jgi:DNA primase
VAALQRTDPLVARIRREELRDEYARRLAGWVSWDDIAMVVRRVRETAGAPAERPRVRTGARQSTPADDGTADRPASDDPRLHLQREVLKAALQLPAVAGPGFDELTEDSFTHPAYRAVRRAAAEAGGACAGLSGPDWLDAVAAKAPAPLHSLVTELAVEPLWLPRKLPDEARYVGAVIAGVRLARVEAQVAELKSKLQRMSPVDQADDYFALAGDLIPLEEYKIALREKAMGAVE